MYTGLEQHDEAIIPPRMSSGTLWISFGVLFIFVLVLEPFPSGISKPVVVNLRDTAVLGCNVTCNGELLWSFESNNGRLEVLKCLKKGDCTEGDGFKRRAKIKHGHASASLTIHPALYNDQGWYKAQCGSEILCTVHLEVLLPTTVNASVGDKVTLPCYARTEKDIADDAVNILWKKDGQLFLEVKNGRESYGSGVTQRASVSPNHYRDGELSLSISRVTPLDSGLYMCYYKTEEQGNPAAVTLTVTARRNITERHVGDELMLVLFSSEQVHITFSGSEGAEMHVCRVEGNTSTCDPKYRHRAFVVNGSLVVNGLSSSDSGTFTVKDNMGNIMSVCTVTVKAVAQTYHWIVVPVVVFLVLAVIGFVLWCLCCRKGQWQRVCVYFSNRDSTVDSALRQPASISLSHEETGQDMPDGPHTPVEETSPEIFMTTEKDTSVQGFNLLENEWKL